MRATKAVNSGSSAPISIQLAASGHHVRAMRAASTRSSYAVRPMARRPADISARNALVPQAFSSAPTGLEARAARVQSRAFERIPADMTYVVAEPCIKCKYTDCVDVCPVDCFYEGENFLVINPDECIDCGACVPEC